MHSAGQLRGPQSTTTSLWRTSRYRLRRAARAPCPSSPPTPATPRVARLRRHPRADGKLIIPASSTRHEFVEHPALIAERISRYARLVGRERSSPDGLRVRHLVGQAAWTPTSSGPSSPVWPKALASPHASSGRRAVIIAPSAWPRWPRGAATTESTKPIPPSRFQGLNPAPARRRLDGRAGPRRQPPPARHRIFRDTRR